MSPKGLAVSLVRLKLETGAASRSTSPTLRVGWASHILVCSLLATQPHAVVLNKARSKTVIKRNKILKRKKSAEGPTTHKCCARRELFFPLVSSVCPCAEQHRSEEKTWKILLFSNILNNFLVKESKMLAG